MVRALAFLSFCFFAVAGAGCGGGGGVHPVSDCDDFVINHYCPDVYNCGADYSSESDCISYVEAALDCGSITAEKPGLGTCESDLDNAACYNLVDSAGVGQIPSSCQYIFVR